LASNSVWALPISDEFTVFPYACYGLHTAENLVACLNWLQSYYAVVQTCDAKLVEGFPNKSVTIDGG